MGAALGLIAYLTGHVKFAEYLHIPYVAGAGELIVICGALAGAGLGFLWFNTYPAQVFMGDVGALALGGVISSQLFGVSPRDPVVLASVLVSLALVGVLASGIPARRATRVDPIEAMRSD